MAMSPPPLTGKPRSLAPWQEGVAVYLSSDSQPQGIHISISAVLFINGVAEDSVRVAFDVCGVVDVAAVEGSGEDSIDRITLLLTNFLRTGVLNDCWSRISISQNINT